METIPEDCALGRLLAWCEAQSASDLHLRAGEVPVVRVQGRLKRVDESVAPVPDDVRLMAWFLDAFSSELNARITTAREMDASFYHGKSRYRANFSKQRGSQSASFRAVPLQTTSLADLQLPDSLVTMTDSQRGLLMITGPTGQGKSTTARALIEHLNRTTAVRLITVEDPIEYVFRDDQACIEQREVGLDTASFPDGVRNAMRQDPDVIFVGEIRDRESIWTAMQAAETGHLVLTTLHADTAAQAIGRIREYYPTAEQGAIAALLARNLQGLICQRLVPNLMGGRTPCLEILRRDAGVMDAIRDNDLQLLTGILEQSNHVGMHSFDQYLQELLVAGMIDEGTARQYAVNPHRLDLALRGINLSQGILKPLKNN